MSAPCVVTLLRRNQNIHNNISFAARKMRGRLSMNSVSCIEALSLPGQRSVWQSTIRSMIHKPTSEPTDQETNLLDDCDKRERDPEFYTPVPPESAEQQSLLLARPSCQPDDSRISRVAIIGTPNSGKSTLINSLLGRRICAVSQKVHTTMSNALAVITNRNTQVVLLDTPGLINYTQGRRHKLPRSLLVDAKNTLLESDLVAVLVDVSNKWTNMKLDQEILLQLYTHSHLPSILILNKVDALKTKQSLFEITESLTEGVVDGRKFVSPRRKGKFSNHIRESLKTEGTEMTHDEEENKSRTGERNFTPLRSDVLRDRPGSKGTSQWSLDNSAVMMDDVQEMSLPKSSVREDGRIHVHDGSGNDCAELTSSIASTDTNNNLQTNKFLMADHEADTVSQVTKVPNFYRTQGCGEHGSDYVTSDASLDKVVNTVQSHDLETTKKNIMQQYTANLFELSDDTDEIVARKHGQGEDTERIEEMMKLETEKEEIERQREERRRIWKMAKEKNGWPGFKAVYMVSALHGEGVQDLKDFLLTSAKPGDWEYHEDVVTNLTPEEILREAIREKLLETLPQEVPYNISQSTELWRTGDHGELHIVQTLICQKKSHMRMLEKKLAWIGRQATQNLMDAFHTDVKLSLHVRFKK
ncbi:GTPase Era, mitochondrial-like [Lytechinus pictus]|uniref:GTPase Era, mitochondrial-like n=1 Tax=Lytechinus pictus TaxID=7653 RepID=UPI0030B9F14B